MDPARQRQILPHCQICYDQNPLWLLSTCWVLAGSLATLQERNWRQLRLSLSHPVDPAVEIAIWKEPPVNDSSQSATSRPTFCRWYLVAAATLMAAMMYTSRSGMYFMLSFIQEELSLTDGQTAWIVSAFFWSYALAQIPSGWLSDRWGARLMLTIYILSWSFFILLMGWSTSFWFLLAMQLGHGLGQAGAYPTSAGLLSRWMPLRTRGTASSIVAFGGRIGGALAPLVTAWLIVLFVPVESSSLLTARQLANQEIGPLCVRLASNAKPADNSVTDADSLAVLMHACWTGLAAQDQILVSRLADLQRALDSANSTPKLTKPKTIKVAEGEVGELAAGLNKLLAQPQLVQFDATRNIKLAQQAASLIARRDSGTSLSTLETERLNRLVLEGAFPRAIIDVFVLGWRRAITVYGLLGIVVALLYAVVARDRPEQHPWCNAAEIALIQEGRVPPASTVKPKLNWGPVLRSRGLWLSSLSQFGTNIGWLFVTAQFPTYLSKVHHVDIYLRGWLSFLPGMASIVGMLLGGLLTDRLRVSLGLRWGRALPMGLTRFGAAAAYVGCLFATDPWIITGLLMTVAFFTDLGVAATWAFVQDAGGRYVGVVLGFGNMWGNIGAAVAPQCYGLALELSDHNWNVCFLVCATAMIISGIAGLFIDATQPIVQDES